MNDGIVLPHTFSSQAFLNSNQGDFSSILYPLLIYYISGCPQIDVVQTDVVPLADLTLRVLTEANAFLANVTAAVPEISSVCGTDPTSLRILLSEVSRLLCLTADTVLDTIDFFTCSNWNGLYASVMYTAVCYNGNTGFGWIAVTQTVILICSLIFLTLRVAFYELVDESEIEESRSSRRSGRLWFTLCRRRKYGPDSESKDASEHHCDNAESTTQPADGQRARSQGDLAADGSPSASETNGNKIKSRTIYYGTQHRHSLSENDSSEPE
jgi:hypothetical protein